MHVLIKLNTHIKRPRGVVNEQAKLKAKLKANPAFLFEFFNVFFDFLFCLGFIVLLTDFPTFLLKF